jgi:hypothetical protein
VFQKIDKGEKGSLDFEQFERFLRYNCFDFIMDFYDKNYLQVHLFTSGMENTQLEKVNGVRGRVTFAEIMKFIDDCSNFKNSK